MRFLGFGLFGGTQLGSGYLKYCDIGCVFELGCAGF